MAGENLDLQIVIDTLLNSKGFEQAQTGLKTLTERTNESAVVTGKATDKQKGLSRELGGSRGAVADLTRVLLQNIGVSGAAGEAAKAVGLSVSAMGAAISPVTLAATAFVAVAALIAPKLIEWAKSTDETRKATDDLRASMADLLPQLEEYLHLVPRADEDLRRLHDTLLEDAFAKQRKSIGDFDKAIAENNKQIEALQRRNTLLIASGVDVGDVVRKNVATIDELTEANKKLTDQLNPLMAAEEEGVLLGARINAGIEDETKKRELLQRKINEQRQAEEKERAFRKQLEIDTIKESGRRQQEENKRRSEERRQQAENLRMAAERIQAINKEKGAHLEEALAAVQAAKIKKAAIVELWTSAIQAAVGAFTKNKAINIAAAIADTYAAAASVLKMYPGPVGWAMAAVQVAEGLAQVQQIRKAEPGFDDPMSDMIATRLGRKSAEDFVKLWGRGFHGGLVDAIGQPASSVHQNTYNRNVNVNMSGVVGSKTELKRYLTRLLIEGDRDERRSTIG